MKLIKTSIAGVFIVDIEPYADARGFFARTWDARVAKEHGLQEHFDYSCISISVKKGTLRGIHYQKEPHGEVKLVRCTRGGILDVVTDLRPDSMTYKKWIAETISEENHRALYIPKGCAHGFLSLADNTEVLYDIAGDFVPEAASGVRWDDPVFGVDWPASPTVISERDATYPDFES